MTESVQDPKLDAMLEKYPDGWPDMHPLVQRVATLENLVAILSDNAATDSRIAALEAEVKSLRAMVGAESKNFPFECGTTFFAPGDPIPSHSQHDALEGRVFLFADGYKRYAMACVKNKSGKELRAGHDYEGGVVDTKLRHPVAPNNIFWLAL